MKPLNIGMIGYGLMGRAHTNAFRQVSQFFKLEHRPVLKAVCGRDGVKAAEFAANWGYEESKHSLVLGDWLLKSGHRTEEYMADLEGKVFAREWNLPPRHIRSLEAWLELRPPGAGNRKLEDAR